MSLIVIDNRSSQGFMVHKLPESEGEARGQGLFMAINPWLPWFICYILKQDWINGSVATTNMATEIASSQLKHCIF